MPIRVYLVCHGVARRHLYEERGEQLVRQGVYADVLRFRQHILPLAEALSRHVGASCSVA